jgi:hypothetical protein
MMDQNCQYMHNGKVPRFLVYHKCFKSAEAVRHRLHVATELDISDGGIDIGHGAWLNDAMDMCLIDGIAVISVSF